MANPGLLNQIASGGIAAPVSSYYQGIADRQKSQLAQQGANMKAMQAQMAQQNILSQMAQRDAEMRRKQQAAAAQAQFAQQAAQQAPDPQTGALWQSSINAGNPALVNQALRPERGPLVHIGGAQQIPWQEQVRRDQQKLDMSGRWEDARTFEKEAIKAGQGADTEIAQITRAMGLLDTVYTGTGAESLASARRLGRLLGVSVDVEKLAGSEELAVFLGDQVMNRVAQTKGAVSEKEMALFREYSANMGKTREGNKRILEFQMAKAKRARDIAGVIRRERKAGRSAPDVQNVAQKHMEENPLLDVLFGVKLKDLATRFDLSEEEAGATILSYARSEGIPVSQAIERLRAQ